MLTRPPKKYNATAVYPFSHRYPSARMVFSTMLRATRCLGGETLDQTTAADQGAEHCADRDQLPDKILIESQMVGQMIIQRVLKFGIRFQKAKKPATV
jgi:hypothetical protein